MKTLSALSAVALLSAAALAPTGAAAAIQSSLIAGVTYSDDLHFTDSGLGEDDGGLFTGALFLGDGVGSSAGAAAGTSADPIAGETVTITMAETGSVASDPFTAALSVLADVSGNVISSDTLVDWAYDGAGRIDMMFDTVSSDVFSAPGADAAVLLVLESLAGFGPDPFGQTGFFDDDVTAAVFAVVPETEVPLPAAAPLMLAGLFGLAALRRRA